MNDCSVGLLHPGAMGVTLGAALAAGDNRVLWASGGRSEASRARAAEAGLEDARTLETLVRECEMIVSVCPPDAAAALADAVAGLGFAGLYVDANAVAPATARVVAGTVTSAGADFVDGGIIGPPARRAGTTRMYLSGARSDEVVEAFAAGPLAVSAIAGGPGAASALKMTYAAYTKGTTALLAAIHAVARREGVEEALAEEWRISQPDLLRRSAAGIPGSAVKAWRFAGEMQEIAATFEAAGQPGGFHRAAAALYHRLAPFKDASPPPELAEVVDMLTAQEEDA